MSACEHDPFRGYDLAAPAEETPLVGSGTPADDLDSLTHRQLAERSARLGMSGKGTKAELAARIRAHR